MKGPLFYYQKLPAPKILWHSRTLEELRRFALKKQYFHYKIFNKSHLGGIAQWKWLWGCFSYFLLLWSWYQGFWGSSEDCYWSKRVSQMLLVCYNLVNSQNIPINQQQWKMGRYKDTSNVAKKAAEVSQKKEQ